MAFIEFNRISKEYQMGENIIKALDAADFIVEKGELAIILGASGAGKTTALNILGGVLNRQKKSVPAIEILRLIC